MRMRQPRKSLAIIEIDPNEAVELIGYLVKQLAPYADGKGFGQQLYEGRKIPRLSHRCVEIRVVPMQKGVSLAFRHEEKKKERET